MAAAESQAEAGLPVVVVAEDDRTIRELVAATLGLEPRVRVLLAEDGEEALAMVRAERPALIVLDLCMPRLSGHEVCRAIRAEPALQGVKILFMTTMGQTDDIQRGYEAGGGRLPDQAVRRPGVVETGPIPAWVHHRGMNAAPVRGEGEKRGRDAPSVGWGGVSGVGRDPERL